MHILFEGMDLAGKSTLCRRLQAVLGPDWTIRHNSLLAESPIQALADTLRKAGALSEMPLGYLYHAALLAEMELFRPPAGNVIQDSTILLRSIAYHRAVGTPGMPELFEQCLASHPRFDMAFVCVCSRETRLRRLAIRRPANLGPEDTWVRDRIDLLERAEATLLDVAGKHLGAESLDTSNLEDKAASDALLVHVAGRIAAARRQSNHG
ncbi:MAG: hypothetical protein GX595_01220 [Lentisphaerae bacterium]|nr:hypothetical protein [Lentisphaerota bacterium]